MSKRFKNPCTCGGYAHSMNGRDEARPHMEYCKQRQEYNEWYDSVGKEFYEELRKGEE